MTIYWHRSPKSYREAEGDLFFSGHIDGHSERHTLLKQKFELTPLFHREECLSLQTYQKCLAIMGLPNYEIKYFGAGDNEIPF